MELYQHNKEAYDKIQTMFQREDRVAIIHATGTGKSFISLQWLYDNRDKKCLFLAPTYEILDQLERHMQSQGLSLKTFPNLKCMIYDNLASLSVQTLNNLHVDNIVLDEFHRCGAPTWGKAVNTVFQNNPTAKVLGITATPVRYLDNQRDMAQEIFNGNIASEISLSDAIADGILPMPKYISAVYSFDEDLQRIQNKINKVQNTKDKDILQKDLEAAKRTLEKSEGLPEIFAKHLPVRNGKYIVFCKDFAHMQKMMQEAYGWLKDINPNLDIYSVCSEQSRETNQRNVADFERFQNDHIKLLFSIEMLNEGVHVNDVDGVIMLRPTNSPIIYLQQLGRALSVGHKEHPIIFDIVNNINSNKIIYDVYKEVKEKLSGQQRKRNDRKINLADFKIIDELKEPSDFIEALDDLLDRETISGSNFEARFEQLIKFIQDHNGQLPSYYSEDDNEKSLNRFYRHHKAKFSEQQKQRLIDAGVQRKKSFDERFDELIEFIQNHNGQLPSYYSEDDNEKSLHSFYNNYNTKFSEQQEQRLIDAGAQRRKSFDERFDDLIEFIQDHNGQLPSRYSEDDNEKSLHSFYNNYNTKFSEQQKQRLIDAGAQRKKLFAKRKSFDERFDELIKFIQDHNGQLPRQLSEDDDEKSLYSFYNNYNAKFSEQQEQRLIDAGAQRRKSFDERFDELIEFIKDHNGQLPRRSSEDDDEKFLANFYQHHKAKFSEQQKQRLIDAGVQRKKLFAKSFDERFDELIEFIQNHNGQLPSYYSEDDNEKSIVIFYKNNKDKFSEQQKQRLIDARVQRKKLFAKSFDERFDELIEFIQDHNGQLPSYYSEDDNEKSLAIFYKNYKAKFSEQQKQRLIDAGVSAEKLEKKTKCTIDPADGKRVLKQRQKDDLQNGGLTQ